MSGAVFFTLSVAVLLVALRLYQANLTAIIGWPHREVQPDGAVAILGRAKRRSRALPYQQFVKVLVRFVADVEQDSRIAYQLFHILYAYIHGTPSKVIRIRHPTNLPIQLRTAISRVDNYRNSPPFGGVGGGCRVGGGSLTQFL